MATKNHNRQEIVFRDMEKAMIDPAAQGDLEELCFSSEYKGSVFSYLYERLEYVQAEEEFASAQFTEVGDSLFNIESKVERRLVKGVFGLVKDTEVYNEIFGSSGVYRVQSFRFDVGHSFFLDASCLNESFTRYVGFVEELMDVFERIAPHMKEGMQIIIHGGVPNLLEEPRRFSDSYNWLEGYNPRVVSVKKGEYWFIYKDVGIIPSGERAGQIVECGRVIVYFPEATRDEAYEWMQDREEDIRILDKQSKSFTHCGLQFWQGNEEEVVIDDPSSPSDPRFGHKITIYRSSPGSTPR